MKTDGDYEKGPASPADMTAHLLSVLEPQRSRARDTPQRMPRNEREATDPWQGIKTFPTHFMAVYCALLRRPAAAAAAAAPPSIAGQSQPGKSDKPDRDLCDSSSTR